MTARIAYWQGRRADILRGAVILAASIATLVLVLAALLPPQLSGDIAPAGIAADGGFAYVAPVALMPPFGFRVAGDSGDAVASSTLQLLEDGRTLGPPRTGHADIRTLGKGRYSHWGTRLWFSASDSSDPRSSGHRYSIAAKASLHPLAVLAVGLLDLVVLLTVWPWLRKMESARRTLIDGVLVIALTLAALIAAGVFGRINDGAGAPKDTALVVAALLHALGGVVILLAQWTAGAGAARLLLRRRATFANVLTLGFALGLPIAAVLAVVALLLPYGLPTAAACWVLCCLPLWRWHPVDRDWKGLVRTAAFVCPLAIAFGCWMGLLWHGPTDTLDGSPSGDLIYYATSIVSLGTQLYPYLNLGYAYQPLNLYFNMLFPLLGAALSRVAAPDLFLFIAVAGGTSFVLSLGAMLQIYVRATGILAGERVFGLASATLVLAFLVATRYPYWSVESIPVIHAVPLTIAVAYWARKSETWAPVVAIPIAVVGSALSKVVGAAVLVPFAAAAALMQLFRMSRALRRVAYAAAFAGLAYAAWLLSFGATNFTVAPPGPVSLTMALRYHLPASAILPFVLRDVSALLLASAAFLLTDRLRATAIALGFLLFLGYPFLFQFDFVCAAIILGLVACDDPARLRGLRVPVLAAFLLALPAALLTDPAGLSTGLVWLICIGGTVVLVLPRRAALARGEWPRLAAATLLLGLGLTAVARGNLILTSGWQADVLTPQVRQVWLAVKQHTPDDALIFTDQTGPMPTLLGAWNTYAFIGARQIFVSNLYINPATRLDPNRAREVLQENDAVLEGRLAPDRLILPNRYSAYYAVVSCTRVVPITWRRVFGNDSHCLYDIQLPQPPR